MCGGVRYGEVESAVMFVFVHPPFHLSPWNPTSSSFCCPASVPPYCMCMYVRMYVHMSPLACCSTLGELFDHGLDSWAAILLPLSIYSGLGIGKPWGTNAVEGYPALLCKTGEGEGGVREGYNH